MSTPYSDTSDHDMLGEERRRWEAGKLAEDDMDSKEYTTDQEKVVKRYHNQRMNLYTTFLTTTSMESKKHLMFARNNIVYTRSDIEQNCILGFMISVKLIDITVVS